MVNMQSSAVDTFSAATQGGAMAQDNGALVFLPTAQIFPHPDNPRKALGDLRELADSIKANGIFQNLTVIPADSIGGQPAFTVIIGHRRLAAAKLAGLAEVPCVITEMTPKEQMQTMLLENMQRAELTVYEQAQGFQMMLDLGSTVEEISEKSGFSVSTVRRRVKMMELDQAVLKEVSTRQLSLTDFDRLAQIEDIQARNQCLAEIGTENFNHKLSYQLRQQKRMKNLPIVKALLKQAGIKEIKDKDTYGTRYERVSGYIHISGWSEGETLIPKTKSDQLFYCLDEDFGVLSFFEKGKRVKAEKRPKSEIEKEKKIAEAWNCLEEKAAIAYELRSSFVKRLHWNQKNAEAILKGALIAGILEAVDYMGPDRKRIGEILGIDVTAYDPKRGVEALAAVRRLEESSFPAIVYAMFNDSAKENFSNSYKSSYPEYRVSSKLTGIYSWLESLGYEMSDDEKALLNGTHEVFRRLDGIPE